MSDLNISSFNTNNVISMYYMFYGCSSLKELNISHFKFDHVEEMFCMFYGCSNELKNKISEQIGDSEKINKFSIFGDFSY